MVGKVALVLLVPLAGASGDLLVHLLLVLWALSGPRRALEALTLSWVAAFLNPGIYTPSAVSPVLHWLILAAAAVSVAVEAVYRGGKLPRGLLFVVLFVSVVGISSVYVSYAADVSLFKLSSFFAGAAVSLVGFQQTRDRASYWKRWFLVVFAAVVFAGLPLIVSDLGYVKNGRGFQGLTSHPQTYATFLAPFLAWTVVRVWTRQLSGPWAWALIGAASVSLFASQARTGVLASILALLVVAAWWTLGRRSPFVMRRGRLISLGVVTFIGMTIVAVQWPSLKQEAIDFVWKRNVDQSLGNSFYVSRGALIEQSMSNFYESPLLGIGFGVASDPSTFDVQRHPVLGLPIGAVVEKGFAPTAILEEVGVVGFLFFVVMVGGVLHPVFRRSAGPAPAALAMAALFVNFGEAALFAMGGSGVLIWLMLGAARVWSQAEREARSHSASAGLI